MRAVRPNAPAIPRRLTNLLLLGLVVGLAGSGILGWVLPGSLAWPFWHAHRALGVALLLALLLKLPIARASLDRRLRRPSLRWSVLPGVLAGLSLVGSIGLGLAWTLNLVSFDTFWGTRRSTCMFSSDCSCSCRWPGTPSAAGSAARPCRACSGGAARYAWPACRRWPSSAGRW